MGTVIVVTVPFCGQAQLELTLQHIVVTHARRGQIRRAGTGQSRLRSRMLLRIVVFPLDTHRAIEPYTVQLDENILEAVGVAG